MILLYFSLITNAASEAISLNYILVLAKGYYQFSQSSPFKREIIINYQLSIVYRPQRAKPPPFPLAAMRLSSIKK
jgi:hypothetical protein